MANDDDERARAWQWLSERDDSCRVREIARRLQAELLARASYPFASLNSLRISRNTESPWDKAGLPFIVSETDGTYSARDGESRPHARGTLDAAIATFLELLASVRASPCDFQDAVREAIECGANLDQLIVFVLDHKAGGLSQRDAYHALTALRPTLVTERDKDLLLEVMDVVSGFCSPHMRIWDTVLSD